MPTLVKDDPKTRLDRVLHAVSHDWMDCGEIADRSGIALAARRSAATVELSRLHLMGVVERKIGPRGRRFYRLRADGAAAAKSA